MVPSQAFLVDTEDISSELGSVLAKDELHFEPTAGPKCLYLGDQRCRQLICADNGVIAFEEGVKPALFALDVLSIQALRVGKTGRVLENRRMPQNEIHEPIQYACASVA